MMSTLQGGTDHRLSWSVSPSPRHRSPTDDKKRSSHFVYCTGMVAVSVVLPPMDSEIGTADPVGVLAANCTSI